jgi:hypothetical protein
MAPELSRGEMIFPERGETQVEAAPGVLGWTAAGLV